MKSTIRLKLILYISLPLLITYLGMLSWDYQKQRSVAMQQMEELVSERAQSAAAHLDSRQEWRQISVLSH